MKDTWVLTVRTSLPKACENAYGLKLDVYACESFQEGRDAVRKVMNKFAFAKNKMFDEKGKLTRMTWCSRYMVSEKEEECAPIISRGKGWCIFKSCFARSFKARMLYQL